jgi:hypothetical protein
VTLYFRKIWIARIELKLSLNAISPERSQTAMLYHDLLTMNLLHIIMTPTKVVLLPDIDGGLPVPLDVAALFFAQ